MRTDFQEFKHCAITKVLSGKGKRELFYDTTLAMKMMKIWQEHS